ncbi:MAG TPA: uroporphyrinogen decarboxylase family protein [Candidatus Hydrogenedentes bacterium]|jgi:uroporphyrinogen-III decarboxylase|nr:uroporphyrinogen decarboxylase family protein [Candidatus Hydrogenedentota bacterium]
MASTGRELVWQTLRLETPVRAPRQLWYLPWAEIHYPRELRTIQEQYPPDIVSAPGFHREPLPSHGCPTDLGTYIDEFGCEFINIQEGVIGEVKHPQIKDWDRDADTVRFPEEHLTIDRDKINAWCEGKDTFILAGCCPRPFEQLQFLRGSADLYTDLLVQPKALTAFMKRLHAFYCRVLERWAATEVDALTFMDDWGSQASLLISPELWRCVFKPMYRDYIAIAHGAGKAVFMHSDGHILSIFPDLVEMGLDAVNSQLFCMGLEKLTPFAGKITYWGEIDRQHILAEGTPEDARRAVRAIYAHLWKKGGCIAQCEFGPGARPDTVAAVFDAWNTLATG